MSDPSDGVVEPPNGRMRILMLAANPRTTPRSALDEQARAVTEKLRLSEDRDKFEFITHWAVRPDDLLQYLNQYRPHIVHFSGHGGANGQIALSNEAGGEHRVTTQALAELFRSMKDDIRVVVLNAGYSATQARAISQYIDYVVGMRAPIDDRAATVFAAAFYSALGFRRSVEQAFDQATTALMLYGLPDHATPELIVRRGTTPPEPPVLLHSAMSVLLSYVPADQATAAAIGEALRDNGADVRMHDTFLLDDPTIVNAVVAHIVVAVITGAFLDRAETEDELSAVHLSSDRQLLPVVIGPDPVPRQPHGIRVWGRIQRDRLLRLAADDTTFADLVAKVNALASEPADAPAARTAPLPRRLSLWYDWEDGDLVDETVTRLTMDEVSVVSVTSAFATQPHTGDEEIAVLWTPAAKWNRALHRALYTADHDPVYLTTSSSPPLPAGVRTTRLDRPIPPARLPPRNGSAAADVRRRLAEALEANGGIPFHLLGDKFCADRQTALAVETAYRIAVARLGADDPERWAAVLAHAAVLRFRGRWKQALDVMRRERRRGGADVEYGIALDTDWLSLQFESGEVFTTLEQAEVLLHRGLDAGDWPTVIAAQRLCGMYHEETGDYGRARDHLIRAFHYADDLRDSQPLRRRIASRAARTALTVDCVRELAALEWRAGDRDAAREHLARARTLLTGIAETPFGVYLAHIVNYQDARIGYSETHEYEAAKKLLNASYEGLQAFGNPVRLATVLESVARLEMDFLRHRDADVVLLQPTLEKVYRVYDERGHVYLAARAVGALGDLQYALGQWRQAEDYYEAAYSELHRLDKKPETAKAQTMLSRCALRLGRQDDAEDHLDDLLQYLAGDDQAARRTEVRSELARLRRWPLDESRFTVDTDLTEFGEFALHSWMARLLGRDTPTIEAGIVLGVGDDAAVLRMAEDDLIVSTDSVPPALLTDDTPAGARYVARYAVVSALADVMAMGGRPMALLVNLHLPRTKPVAWTTTFMRAAKREAADYGAAIVGGDLKESLSESLATVALGRVHHGRAITRNGAQPDDLLVVTLSGGSGHLAARWAHELWIYLSKREQRLLADVVQQDARFESLGLPVEIMEAVTDAQLPTSAMDTSDGILACAQLMGRGSRVGFEIFPDAIEAHLHPTVLELAAALGIAPYLFGLNHGHDWEIVFTVADRDRSQLENTLDGRPTLAVIGRAVPREGWADSGVRVAGGEFVLPYFTNEKFATIPYQDRAREWLDWAREATRHAASHRTGTEPQ